MLLSVPSVEVGTKFVILIVTIYADKISEEEIQILREFDHNSEFGPCIGELPSWI